MNSLDALTFRLFGPAVTGPMLLMGIGIAAVVLAVICWLVLRPKRAVSAVQKQAKEIDPFVQGSRKERRSGVRRRGNAVAVRVAEEWEKEGREEGLIHDRSTGGLGLVLEREVPVETVLKVRPTSAPVTTPWVEVEVRNCRPLNGKYRVGCQFKRTPSWDVMLAFG
jgi:hypothetical protein